MSGALRSDRGTTLAEAVVAIGVFGIALVGLANMLVTTVRTSELARDLATARFLASNRLEQIRNSRYQDGNRDAYRDTSDPCTDIDEVTTTAFPDETYGAVDLLNGTRFAYRACTLVPNIKQTGTLLTRASYPAGAQGEHDYQVNHGQYARFRREVYIVDSSDYTDAIRRVSLGPAHESARDDVIVDAVAPTEELPASRYMKYVFVRVKWRDSHRALHQVTLSTEKAFYIPSS